MSAKRSYGSGSLFVERNAAGVESWYGRWRVDGRQVTRKLGHKRQPGTSDGLTKSQAERALRDAMASDARPRPQERLTLSDVGERYLNHLETRKGRKKATVDDYRIILRRHLAGPQDVEVVRGRRPPKSPPFFKGNRLDQITPSNVEAYVDLKVREGLAASSIDNQINFLHGIFAFAIKRRWATSNPVVGIDRPRGSTDDAEIRFLTTEEVEALLRTVADDDLGPTDHALFLTAAMTGLRQGELLALRWRDVDWTAGVVRVRRSFSRGELGTPKSKRSSRAVPLPLRVASALEQHFQRSQFTGDDDLVFAHPHTGGFYDRSTLYARFKAALVRGEVRDVRFHDLRHTYGTRMAAAGAPLRAIQEWMGHRDISTTMRYADYAPDPSGGREWAERAFASPALGQAVPAVAS